MSHKETLVLFAMAIADKPVTINDISFRSKVSYNTVKKIVTTDPRVSIVGNNPTYYYFAKPDVLNEQVVRLTNKRPKEGWVSWATKIAYKLTLLIQIDKKAKANDVQKQGLVLEALGINFILWGRDLQKHYDKPDWFALIGGDEND